MAKGLNQHGFAMDVIERTPTPFYYYDMTLLEKTLDLIVHETAGYPYAVHFAIKANNNPQILKAISRRGFRADVVSGGEIMAAIENGFKPCDIIFSGVAKTDAEIRLGLEKGIGCYNVESLAEVEVIDEMAGLLGKTAHISIRVNPDIDAHTHKYITTGKAANKFGIGIDELDTMLDLIHRLGHVHLLGLHFHIGSQITQMQPFALLCETANRLMERYGRRGIHFQTMNMGGGLGIDYTSPDEHPFAPFQDYFDTFKQGLKPQDGTVIHFELGRSVVAPCGTLMSRVVFTKENRNTKFVLIDAGMNDLLRPALYGSRHVIQNLTSRESSCDTYDVVGPLCESSDVFATGYRLPLTHRGDIIAIRSAGAYGETMASRYNMRPLASSVFYPHP